MLELCQIIASYQCAPSPTYAHFYHPNSNTPSPYIDIDKTPIVGKVVNSWVVMIEEKSPDPFDVSQQKIVTTSSHSWGCSIQWDEEDSWEYSAIIKEESHLAQDGDTQIDSVIDLELASEDADQVNA